MVDKTNRIRLTALILFSLVALFFGLFVGQHLKFKDKDMSNFSGVWLENPRDIAAISLQDTANNLFNNESFTGHWTMLFFGFTSCPSLCPTTMAELGKMYRKLESLGVKNLPQVIMVSLDPQRDNPEKLGNYVRAFDRHFLGLTGDEQTINKMAREMGIASTKVDGSDEQSYNIEHTGTVILINPNGKINGFFTSPLNADALAKDYKKVVGQ